MPDHNSKIPIPGGGGKYKRPPEKRVPGEPYPPSGHTGTRIKYPDGGGQATSAAAATGGSSSSRRRKADESPVLNAASLKKIKEDLKPTGKSTPVTSSPNSSTMSLGDTGEEEVTADVSAAPDVPFATAYLYSEGRDITNEVWSKW